MSSGNNSEASRTAGLIGIGGMFVAAGAAYVFFLAFHRSLIVAALTLAIGVFVALWGIFLALALLAALFDEGG